MKWFDNPRKRRSGSRKGRRRKGKRRPPKGGWKKYMARLRAMKKRKHSGGTMARRRKRRRRASNRRRHRVRGHSMRRGSRRIRVRAHLSNPRRRRYRRRHNPPRFSLGGVINRAKAGAVDAVWIVGGKAVTNIIPSLLGPALADDDYGAYLAAYPEEASLPGVASYPEALGADDDVAIAGMY